HAPRAVAAAQTVLPPVAGAVVPAAAAAPAPSAIPFDLGAPQFAAALLWLGALVMLAASVGLLLVVRIILAILLVLGPVFVAFALFGATRGLFEGWLRMAVRFALVPLFALPLIAALVAVLAPMVADLDGPVTSLRDGPILVILLIVLVFAAVMLQASRLGGGIASSIRLPRGRAVVPGATAAAGSDVRVVRPAATASRAELLVEGLRSTGGRGGSVVAAGGHPGADVLVATRRIGGGGMAVETNDFAGRLGQSYRRLAIGAPVVPVRRPGH
ncbi:MAG: type IV secretion system protein, partial [Janthinobacterium lividum]